MTLAVVQVTDAKAAAERLLADNGTYSPIELLLATNNLTYDEYRAWRKGGRRTLDDALAAGVEATSELIEAVDSWARSLPLHPEFVPLYGIDANAGAELTASTDAGLDALLHTEYRAPADRRQTDLFLDTSDTQAINELVTSLAARDAVNATAGLERLARLDSGHWMLGAATILVGALTESPPASRVDALRRMQTLEQQWLPAAQTVLRGGARDFVTPMWRAVAAALDDGAPFDATLPKQHASFAYRKGLDWPNVRRTVREIPAHETEPLLLEALAEAEWRLRNRREAVSRWFSLCWLAPGHFADAVHATGFPDTAVRRSWDRLQDQNWGTVTAAWLPAWMLLDEPGIGRRLQPTHGTCAAQRAFDLLLRLKAGGSDREDIDNRRALQELHPELFDRYLTSLDE